MTAPKHYLLPAVVFLTGASVLIVEVLAVRVLSPYYGNTIFTVSSVISVILLALSIGYYAGGVLADRRPSLPWFFGIILLSGLLLLLFQFLGTLLLPPLSEALSIDIGPLVSSALLFLLPALLLGTLSPYAVKLQSVYFPAQGVGGVAGQIFFWSTLGSLTGSLLAGFVLIPRFGIDRILIANGVGLCVLGFVPLLVLRVKTQRLYVAGAAFVLLLGAPWLTVQRAREPADETVIYLKDGVYQKITIYEGPYFGRPTRFLLLDRSESGAMFLDADDPAELVYDYTKYYSLYKIFAPRVENALVLGGGAYSIPKALLHELPSAVVDVAEIEPSFFDLARKYFRAVDTPRLRNFVEDGRRFLHDADKKYELIFGDVYYSYFSVPPHFTTKEFFALAKDRLSPDGVFIANMIGDLSRRQPSLIMAEIKTFQAVFPNSYFFAVDAPEKTDLVQNITLVGYNSDKAVDVGSPPVTTHPDPLIRFLRYKVIDVGRRFDLSPYPILTDNFSPVEYLTAEVLQRSLDRSTDVDGNEVLALVDQQLRYGPRQAGTPGHGRVQNFLLAEMQGLAQEVTTQAWSQPGPDGNTVELSNIIGRLFASEDRRVILATHYDRSPPGVALLVELTRMLITSPVVRRVGVDMVFLDGGDAAEASLGSTYFAAHLNDMYEGTKPIAALVLEAVCGRELVTLREESPETAAFNHAGIPSVVMRGGDVLDTCTADGLATVADAVINYLDGMQ